MSEEPLTPDVSYGPVTPTRYDLLLLAIPLVFAGTFLLGQVLRLEHPSSLAVSSVTSSFLIGAGLFVNPPSEG